MTPDPKEFNAGTCQSLERARSAAQARVRLYGHSVTVYAHISDGSYLWRDDVDANGKSWPGPPRQYQAVETVTP